MRHFLFITSALLLGSTLPSLGQGEPIAEPLGSSPHIFPEVSRPAQIIPQGTKTPVHFWASYLTDYFYNTQGGLQTGDSFMGLFDFGAEFDLYQILGWEGAAFVISAIGGHGSDFSARYVGDFGVVSNLYTDTNFNIYHLYFQQSLDGGESFFRIGQFAIDDDFMLSDTASLFLSSPIGPFNTQSGNMPAPIFPLAAPGLLLKYSPTDAWYWMTGVYLGNAGAAGPRNRGFEWAWGGPSGWSIFSEVGYSYDEDGGVLKAGGYWHTGDVTNFANGATENGIGAFYAIVDHPLIGGGENTPSLHAFARGSIAGKEDRVTVTSQVDGGLVSRNLFLPEDALGVSVSHTAFGDAFLQANPGSTSGETVVEATYRIQVNEHFAIQPDVQYIINPQGSGRDAVAVGIRGEIGF